MPEIRSYIVERTQRVFILSAESPAHAIALAEEVFRKEPDMVRTTDISAREDY